MSRAYIEIIADKGLAEDPKLVDLIRQEILDVAKVEYGSSVQLESQELLGPFTQTFIFPQIPDNAEIYGAWVNYD